MAAEAGEDKMLIRGLVPALVTPFKSEADGGGLDVEAVPVLVDSLLSDGVSGFYVGGNTGEGYTMSKEEREAMTVATVAAVDHRVPVIIHVGAAKGGTEESIALAKHAKESGADAVSSVVPVDKPNNFAAALDHFKAVGSASDLPFYVYWVAKDADKTIAPEDWAAAMAEVPNFAGFKYTDTNFYVFQRLLKLTGKNCVTGPDEMNLAGKIMGSHAAIGSTYNIQPKIFLRMDEMFRKGDKASLAEAMKLQEQANEVIAILIRECNVLAEGGLAIIRGIKAIMNDRGLPAGAQRARDPLTEEQTKSLLDAIAALPFKVE